MVPARPRKMYLDSGSGTPFFCALKCLSTMNKKNEATSTVVAKINNVEIIVIENGQKRVPIKPICEALGIDEDAQRRRLKEDPILSSTTVLSTAVAADGKNREMVTIPFRYVFGWLFRIDSRNVKEEAREAVLKYQVQCYDALYNHFTRYAEYVEYQKEKIEEQLVIVEAINHNFRETKNQLIEAKEELNRRRRLTYQEYQATLAQLQMFTADEMGGM